MCVPEDVLSHQLMAPCLRSSTLFLSSWLRFWQWQGMFWCAGPSALTVTSRASPTSLWCHWLWRTSQWDSWPFHSLSPSAQASAAILMGASSLHASCWSSHRAPSSVCWPLPWIGTSPSRSHWGEWMVLLCLFIKWQLASTVFLDPTDFHYGEKLLLKRSSFSFHRRKNIQVWRNLSPIVYVFVWVFTCEFNQMLCLHKYYYLICIYLYVHVLIWG